MHPIDFSPLASSAFTLLCMHTMMRQRSIGRQLFAVFAVLFAFNALVAAVDGFEMVVISYSAMKAALGTNPALVACLLLSALFLFGLPTAAFLSIRGARRQRARGAPLLPPLP